jgi:hypothetical protein
MERCSASGRVVAAFALLRIRDSDSPLELVHVGNGSDHCRSRNCLFFPDSSGAAAERQKWRLGRGFRRTGQPNSLWSTRSGVGSFPGNNVVRDHFHDDIDYALDFRGAANRTYVRVFGREAESD